MCVLVLRAMRRGVLCRTLQHLGDNNVAKTWLLLLLAASSLLKVFPEPSS